MMKMLQKFEGLDRISKQGYKHISGTFLKMTFGFSGALFWLVMSMVNSESYGMMVSLRDSNIKLTTETL